MCMHAYDCGCTRYYWCHGYRVLIISLQIITHELVEGGCGIPVTASNR